MSISFSPSYHFQLFKIVKLFWPVTSWKSFRKLCSILLDSHRLTCTWLLRPSRVFSPINTTRRVTRVYTSVNPLFLSPLTKYTSMPPKAASEKPARKSTSVPVNLMRVVASNWFFSSFPAKSSGGGGKKRKLSAFNKFMASPFDHHRCVFPSHLLPKQQTELARLKEADPDVAHQDRCELFLIIFSSKNLLTYGLTGSKPLLRTGANRKTTQRTLETYLHPIHRALSSLLFRRIVHHPLCLLFLLHSPHTFPNNRVVEFCCRLSCLCSLVIHLRSPH